MGRPKHFESTKSTMPKHVLAGLGGYKEPLRAD